MRALARRRKGARTSRLSETSEGTTGLVSPSSRDRSAPRISGACRLVPWSRRTVIDKRTSLSMSAVVIAVLTACVPARAAETGAADPAKPPPEHAVRKIATQPVAPHRLVDEDAYRCHPSEDTPVRSFARRPAGTMIVTLRPAGQSAVSPAWIVVSGAPPSGRAAPAWHDLGGPQLDRPGRALAPGAGRELRQRRADPRLASRCWYVWCRGQGHDARDAPEDGGAGAGCRHRWLRDWERTRLWATS